jgi:hypothetical protein
LLNLELLPLDTCYLSQIPDTIRFSLPQATTMLAIKFPVTQIPIAVTLFTTLSIAPPAFAQSAPNPIDALPADASGIVLMSTNPQTWSALSQFNAFPPGFSPLELIFQLFHPNSTFSNDWQPWMGDRVGIGYMADGKMLMIAPIKDATLATEFLDRFTTKQPTQPQKIRHNNIDIQYWQPKTQPKKPPAETLPETSPAEAIATPVTPKGFAIAHLPSGYIVQAETPETLKQLINSSNQPRLSTHPDLQKLQQNPKYATALFIGFGDYSKIMPALKAAQMQQSKMLPPLPGIALPNPTTALQTPSAVFDAIANLYGSISGIIWAEPTGIRLTTSISLKQPFSPIAPSPQPTAAPILSYVPGVSYVVGSGPSWYNLMRSGQAPAFDPKLTAQLKQQSATFQPLLQTFLGINETELTHIFGQESAFFVFPSKQGFLPNRTKIDLGFGLAARTNNRNQTEAALEKLTQHFQQRFNKSVKLYKRTINGVPVVSLEAVPPKSKGIQKLSKSPRQSFFSYSWVQPDTVLILSNIDNNLIPKPWQTLTDSPNFQDAIVPLPKDHQGFFYMNGGASIAFVFNSVLPQFIGSEFLQSPFVDQIKASLGSIRSISSTLQVTPDAIVGESFMVLGTQQLRPQFIRGRVNSGVTGDQDASTNYGEEES